jgi:hypothetical protein
MSETVRLVLRPQTSATTAEIEQVQAEDRRLAEAARRRPLDQFEIVRFTPHHDAGEGLSFFRVYRSPAGSKPSHQLIDKPVHVCSAPTLELARASIPRGFKRLARRKDDRADVVEVWV